ncbi:Fur family transcriptional regulator [Pseudochrobactrum sp. AO18b]|uniref:Fur family transcriptional regulator n=1 Tax=Pseudochrobactrum sp. AO18b TaxID=1201036 RepID=UPI00039FF8FC|nr:Fur family transcriptional regulator [Pseudochrobactrum sp. AO18b]
MTAHTHTGTASAAARAPKLTRNQNLVLEALAKAEFPLSAYTILDQLREEGFRAPLQVYRALDKLLEYGLIHRLESLNAFIACAHPHHHEHGHLHGIAAFAICDKCGLASEFSEPEIEDCVQHWTQKNHFHPTKTTLEIRGLCASCARN